MDSLLMWSVSVTGLVLLSGLLVQFFLFGRPGPRRGCGAAAGPGGPADPNARAEEPDGQQSHSSVSDNENRLGEQICPGAKDLKARDSPSDAAHGRPADHGSSPAEPPRAAAGGVVRYNFHNLPGSRFPRDVRFRAGVPGGLQVPGFQGLFTLSLIYRRDMELHVQWRLDLETSVDGHHVEPWWVAYRGAPRADPGRRRFRGPGQGLEVGVLQRSSQVLSTHDYLMRSSSCRFYLSPRDGETRPFPAPPARLMLTAGRNSGNAAPSVPFRRRRDLPHAADLAEVLLSLDAEYQIFMSLFKWRQFYHGRRRLPEEEAALVCRR